MVQIQLLLKFIREVPVAETLVSMQNYWVLVLFLSWFRELIRLRLSHLMLMDLLLIRVRSIYGMTMVVLQESLQ